MENIKLNIHSIETLGTHEGPGLRFVLFLQGCPLRCLYCHNPDSQSISTNKLVNIQNIIEKVLKQKAFFKNKGGITVSGGEPTLQARELIPLFKELKSHNINTVIDTSGFILNDDVKELLELTDLVLLDIKQINDEKHKSLTNVSNKNILKFAKYLEENDIKFWIRYVLVPSYTDDENDIEKLGEYFKDFKNLERIEILPFHKMAKEKYNKLGMDFKLDNIKAPIQESLHNSKQILEKNINKVYIRN